MNRPNCVGDGDGREDRSDGLVVLGCRVGMVSGGLVGLTS